MNLQVLKTELDGDPLVRGYSGMTDQEAADDLNTVYRQRNRAQVSGANAYDLTDSTEYDALTDAKKSQWLSLCAIESVDPFGPAVGAVIDIFGGASTTVSNLQSYRVESISRAIELGLGEVTPQHVKDARAI